MKFMWMLPMLATKDMRQVLCVSHANCFLDFKCLQLLRESPTVWHALPHTQRKRERKKARELLGWLLLMNDKINTFTWHNIL